MFVTKRSGKRVEFDRNKIFTAINNANECTRYKYKLTKTKINEITDAVVEAYEAGGKTKTAEYVKDLIEEALIDANAYGVAKEYITYRYKRDIAKGFGEDFLGEITKKLKAADVQNQNANVDEQSFGGRIGEASSVMTKKFALDNLVSKMARENHINNEIYIHDLDSYSVGMHNCCARETKFITKDFGVRSFEDYEDGSIVSVLNHDGGFNFATIKKFGIQKLNKITFSLAGQRFVTERFTNNHRWILADGSETTQLKIGDKLYKAPIHIRDFNWEAATEKERYYWCLGFVLADGTEAYRYSHGKKYEDIRFVRLRLCGEDKIKYESRFADLKHSTKEMENGDLYLTFSSVIGFRKIFPNLEEMTRLEKLALFDGLYCADGQHSASRKSILTTDEQIASFIEDEAPALGYFILNIKDKTGEKTNYAIRKFTKEYTFIGDLNKYYWTVVDIEEDKEEEVWCLQVEGTHSFVLPNGITTGNCLSVPFDDLLKTGFNTRQTDVRPAGSVNTAFQLVAVIFQLQSLQQFGGVSATHLDWTMVPYVRMSFLKHYNKYREFVSGIPMVRKRNKVEIAEIREFSILDFSKFALSKHNIIDKLIFTAALKDTNKEIHQAVEGMYHNLNTLQSRSGNQLPFTSINYGTCTLKEGRMVTKALLDVSIEGLGKLHKTSIFPCGIFQCMNGVNRKPGDPNYDLFRLALESTSKRLYPNYACCDWSVNNTGDEYDQKIREDYINSLSDEQYNKLISKLQEHPELQRILGLTLEEGERVSEN